MQLKLKKNEKTQTTMYCTSQLALSVKSNLSLNSLYCAEACNELFEPISLSFRPGNTASFEEMLQRRRAVNNTVSDLTGLKFEPQTSRTRDQSVTLDQLASDLICITHSRWLKFNSRMPLSDWTRYTVL